MTAQPSPTAPFLDAMLQPLAQNWWVLLLRGVAAVLFGALAFAWPGLTLLTLTLVWGAFALVDGLLALWAAVTGRGGRVAPRWWLAVAGLAGLAIGVLAFLNPAIVAGALLLYIAVWAIIIGVLEIWGGWKLRKEIRGEWLLILTGALWGAAGPGHDRPPRRRRPGRRLDHRRLGDRGRRQPGGLRPAPEKAQG